MSGLHLDKQNALKYGIDVEAIEAATGRAVAVWRESTSPIDEKGEISDFLKPFITQTPITPTPISQEWPRVVTGFSIYLAMEPGEQENIATMGLPPLRTLRVLPPERIREITLSIEQDNPKEDHLLPGEALAWLAGEPISPYPASVDRHILAFIAKWSEHLGKDERNRLIRPLLPLIVNSVNPGTTRQLTFTIAAWTLTEALPAWLELAGLKKDAKAMRSLMPPGGDPGSIEARAVREALLRAHNNTVSLSNSLTGHSPNHHRAIERSATMAAYLASPKDIAPGLVPDTALQAARAAELKRKRFSKTISQLQESASELVRSLAQVSNPSNPQALQDPVPKES